MNYSNSNADAYNAMENSPDKTGHTYMFASCLSVFVKRITSLRFIMYMAIAYKMTVGPTKNTSLPTQEELFEFM